MAENLPPYTFNAEELHSKLQENLVRTENFKFGEETYEYGIFNSEAFPVKFFTGMQDGMNLMISEELAEDLRRFWLMHEIRCNRLEFPNEGRCADIERDLINSANEEIRERLLAARWEMFRSLVLFMKIDPNDPQDDFAKEIAGTYKYLKGEIEL